MKYNKTFKRDFENTHFFCKERKKTACSRNPLTWRYILKELVQSKAEKLKSKDFVPSKMVALIIDRVKHSSTASIIVFVAIVT